MAGAPAFGMAESLSRRATAAMRCTVSSIGCGPWLQLAPTTGDVPVLERAHDVLRLVAVERGALLGEGQGDR